MTSAVLRWPHHDLWFRSSVRQRYRARIRDLDEPDDLWYEAGVGWFVTFELCGGDEHGSTLVVCVPLDGRPEGGELRAVVVQPDGTAVVQ